MDELEAAVDKLCFYEQPIFAVNNEDTKGKLQEYELLLREAGEDNKFPAALFKEYIRDNESNRIFCNWMANELKELVKNKPDQYFSFNIEQQQLLYPSTIEALKALIPYQKTLMVEITEAIPSKRYFDQYYNNSMIEPIKQVHELGFRIAIDDVSSGMNSFNIVREYGEYIDRIKLSLLQLRNVSKDLVQETVMLWRSMAIDNQIDLIIEGIDNLSVSDWLVDNSIKLQQGYYWGRPRAIEKN